jgi:nicotinamide-nucleotide amidase
MNYSILSVGDEICIGQIVNTNSVWIAEKLVNIGFSANLLVSVPDESNIMKSELHRLIENSDVVIITGGLGPTHDDITKAVLTEYFDDTLIQDESTYNYLKTHFESRGRALNDKILEQALIPSKSIALKNRAGTAPGLLFKVDKKMVFALPGVPEEMKNIFENEIIPIVTEFFFQNTSEYQVYRTIKTSGIFESTLSDLIGGPENFPHGTSLAYLPSSGSVRLRIGAKSSDKSKANEILEKFNQYIISKAGKYIVGYGNDNLQLLIGKLLSNKKLTVSVAESCTGGMLGAAFTDVSGSSLYFKGGIIAYSNEIKLDILKINELTLNEFGAVSEQTALEMAEKARQMFVSDLAISITGIAGPDGGTSEKPVGSVWIGISDKTKTYAKLFNFGNNRIINRERAVNAALELLRQRIQEL